MKESFDNSKNLHENLDDSVISNLDSPEQVEQALRNFIKDSLDNLGVEIVTQGSQSQKEQESIEDQYNEFVDMFMEGVKGNLDTIKDEIDAMVDNKEGVDHDNTESHEKNEHTSHINKQLNKLDKKSILTVYQDAQKYYKQLLIEGSKRVKSYHENDIQQNLTQEAVRFFPGPIGRLVGYLRDKAQ